MTFINNKSLFNAPTHDGASILKILKAFEDGMVVTYRAVGSESTPRRVTEGHRWDFVNMNYAIIHRRAFAIKIDRNGKVIGVEDANTFTRSDFGMTENGDEYVYASEVYPEEL